MVINFSLITIGGGLMSITMKDIKACPTIVIKKEVLMTDRPQIPGIYR
jgi:hypothetical protein